MNIQAMMKQAQKIQKEMTEEKLKIDSTIYEGKSSFVTVEVSGDKKIKKITIDQTQLEKDDIEILEDILIVAINDAMNKIDQETEMKLGKYTQGMPGLF